MMAFQNAGGPRQMFDITALAITCAECGAAIDKLPFEPTKKEDGTYGRLYCFDCNKNRMRSRPPRGNFGGGGGRF